MLINSEQESCLPVRAIEVMLAGAVHGNNKSGSVALVDVV